MISKETLEELKGHKPVIIGMREAKKAAVGIPLLATDHGYELLFEVRAAHIASQPGDICFPGGMAEPGETMEETAVREMCEELALAPEQISVLGLMDLFGGGSGLLYVYPYAVFLQDYHNTFSPDEVDRILRIPLDFFLENEPEVYHTTLQVLPEEDFPYERVCGGKNYGWRKRRDEVLFYSWQGETIWGMTAKILHAFVQCVREIS